MISHATPQVRRASIGLAAMVLGVAAACGRNEAAGRDTATQAAASDSAAGVTPVDTTTTTATLTPAAPAPPPTAADANVVRDALESKLTEDNLKKFMNAGSRLAFLRARDAQLRGSLQSMGASREKTDDAALARLEHNAQISKAISDAGLSVRDYYTMSLAIASARRFVGNPGAAPPTPTLRDNAKFLRDHKQQLAHLRVWGQ